ncbi:uncharacterized protein J7T54_006587 [Emericellopsis cladophorae]|uniref:MFS transporter n=1 Tax=Emericellopsis cladophorae TaxID=2686198 RepID=A0A9P9Y6T9_9HYPO|nr:uncharacterized protein J7T54_006587 [Emericellopsis cladophorae]KAI6784542.1 hypothetical protein J7T54_006587 [Emericellopsis cladophorae]
MSRILSLCLLVAALVTLVAAGAPTFCKCTCFKNSTIIPLGPEHASEGSDALPRRSVDLGDFQIEPRTASTSCSECTKSFCLGQGIDICEDATEDDVMTMCFQRDSNKDRIIVWGFIIGVVGLLGWALFRKARTWREERSFVRQDANYAPVSGR